MWTWGWLAIVFLVVVDVWWCCCFELSFCCAFEGIRVRVRFKVLCVRYGGIYIVCFDEEGQHR